MKKSEGSNKRPNPSKDTEHHEGGGGEITIAPSAIAVTDPLPEIAVSSSSSNPTENPFVPSLKRRKHNAITVSQKQGVLQLIDEGKTYEEISRIYGIAQSTISNIKENRKQINDLSLQNITSMNNFSNNSNSNSNNNNTNNNNNSTPQASSLSLNYHNYNSKLLKPRLSKCSQIIDERLCEWIVHAQEKNIAISGPKIVEKGKIIASKLNIEFKGSNGWLESFKKRHNISFRDFRRPTVVASNVTIEDAEEENGAGGVNGEGEENLKDWERKILLAEVEEGEPTTTSTSLLNGNGSDSSDPPSEDEGYEGKDKSLKKLVAEVIDIAANQNHEKISKSTPSKAFRPSNRAITQINVASTGGDEELQQACQGLIDFTNYCEQHADMAKLIGVSEPVKQLLRGIVYETSKLPFKK